MTKNRVGYFIVVDGPNGSGKTTQCKLLKEHFENLGHDVILTREPGGSPEAESIRNLLVNGDPGRWDGISELLLFAAARRNHVETVIKPAIASGKIVICDRFISSTIAYQGYGNGISLDTIDTITQIAIGSFEPDLTILMFVDLETSLVRSKGRRAGVEPRFTSFDNEYHTRVYKGFESLIPKYGVELSSYVPLYIRSQTTIAEVTTALINIITPQLLRKEYRTPSNIDSTIL